MSIEKPCTCNLCGLDCALTASEGGLLDARVYGGYDSTPGNGAGALDDCTSYKFSLCEFCLDWLFEQFKVPVEVRYDGEFESFRPAAHRVLEDHWRRHKDQFMKEYERRNGARERRVKLGPGN